MGKKNRAVKMKSKGPKGPKNQISKGGPNLSTRKYSMKMKKAKVHKSGNISNMKTVMSRINLGKTSLFAVPKYDEPAEEENKRAKEFQHAKGKSKSGTFAKPKKNMDEAESYLRNQMNTALEKEEEPVTVKSKLKEFYIPSENSYKRHKNKILRARSFARMKQKKAQALLAAKRELKPKLKWKRGTLKPSKPELTPEEKAAKQVPDTIDNCRVPDITMITGDDEELEIEEMGDEYSKYFSKQYDPKVVITSTSHTHTNTARFMKDLATVLPNAVANVNNQSNVQKIIAMAKDQSFTDVIVVNEDAKAPSGMLLIHLPNGPTAHFRVSSVKTCQDIIKNIDEITVHRPEVILNNFKTRLGRMVARMLGAIFNHDPEFHGRRACTFHNQRDYIFFRHHRYEFRNTEKVSLLELGPEFTLRLESLQEGAFEGDYIWLNKRHQLETSRRKFSL